MSADDAGPNRYSDQRVSDAEREQVVQLLNKAMVEGRITLAEFDERSAEAYAARFRSDFLPITSDLLPVPLGEKDPVPQSSPESVQDPNRPFTSDAPLPYSQSSSGALARVDGVPGPGSSLAMLGGVERTGLWHVAQAHSAVAIMGGVELDLRQARLEAQVTDISASAIWGGVEIIVPLDVRVDVDGTGIMGGYSNIAQGSAQSAPPPPPDAPLIRVRGLALMGGVEVIRKA